jgi:antitoxin component of RelBE/YafQ-DinJ toxin-antitoxin module
MPKKIISLSVDEDVYRRYIRLCKENGIVMSKQVENFMSEIIKRFKK